MRRIETELLIPCDIDQTLICWDSLPPPTMVEFIDPYDNRPRLVVPHKPNIKIMMNYLERGATVLVWSRSGYKWAEAALKALNIDHDNIIVASKPFAYIDDKPGQEWMGEQVFLPIDSNWGQ